VTEVYRNETIFFANLPLHAFPFIILVLVLQLDFNFNCNSFMDNKVKTVSHRHCATYSFSVSNLTSAVVYQSTYRYDDDNSYLQNFSLW
jgi:hypothetical protein